MLFGAPPLDVLPPRRPETWRRLKEKRDEGDENVKAAASVGALESIQVQSTHRPFGPNAFLPWLGPKSREAWDAIEATLGAGGGSLAGVVRLERELVGDRVNAPPRWWQFWRR